MYRSRHVILNESLPCILTISYVTQKCVLNSIEENMILYEIMFNLLPNIILVYILTEHESFNFMKLYVYLAQSV